MRPLGAGISGLYLTVLLAGCTLSRPYLDRASVSTQVEERIGQGLGPPALPGAPVLPADLPPGAKLDEERAVLLALWNNPAFHELLTELEITHGDLVQAGLLPNPELIYFFGAPDKPFKYALELPIEAIWLRPIRLRIAEEDNARACQRLVQAALDLMRDTRQAYADVLLARERIEIAQRAVEIRNQVARLARTRFEDGDASRQEVATAHIEELLNRQTALRVGYDLPLAEARLVNLLGLIGCKLTFDLDAGSPCCRADLALEPLFSQALEARPDVLAARHAILAAEERLELTRISWFRLLGLVDATSGRARGHELGPAFRVMLPVFNCNEGNILRAEAECERARRALVSVQNQVALDVRLAHVRYQQACRELDYLTRQVRPEVETAVRRAERSYRNGHTTYLLVLETTRQLLDTYDREAQLHADIRRSWADLERSVGKHLGPRTSETTPRRPLPKFDLDRREKEEKKDEDDDEDDGPALPKPRPLTLPGDTKPRRSPVSDSPPSGGSTP